MKASKIDRIFHVWHTTFHHFSACWNQYFPIILQVIFVSKNKMFQLLWLSGLALFLMKNMCHTLVKIYENNDFKNVEKRWKFVCQAWMIWSILEVLKTMKGCQFYLWKMDKSTLFCIEFWFLQLNMPKISIFGCFFNVHFFCSST